MSNCGYCDLYGPWRCSLHGAKRSVLSWSRPERHRCRVERLPTPPPLLAPWAVVCKRCPYASCHRTHQYALKAAFAHASSTREVVV